MENTKKVKLRVLEPFNYRGKDGNSKTYITVSPGEEIPPLSVDERNRLLHEQKICEVDLYGENVVNKKLVRLNDEEIQRLFLNKTDNTILGLVVSTNFEKETLAKMLAFAEVHKVARSIISCIEQKLEN